MRITLLTAEVECAKCREAKAVLARVHERFPQVDVRILKCTDPEASEYGIVMSPTVIVDDTLIASGRAPREDRLVAYLEALA